MRTLKPLCALALLSTASVAWGAQPPTKAIDPLTRKNGWLSGSIQEQLDRDGRLIPYGKGAIFVPAMTHGLDEPPITIYSGDSVVEESTAGQRIVLKPGRYRIELGSGSGAQRMSTEAVVRERNTTVIPPFWSGLSVHVVDVGYNSLRAGYELIRADDREYYGIGFGTNEQAGEPVATWVLPPGLYKIVRVGETYRARTSFTTVRLEEGALTHVLLVQDVDTGDFLGAGEVPIEELFRLGSGLGANLIVGGDVTFGSRNNSPTTTDGNTISFRAFVDGRVNYNIDAHHLTARLQVEEGQTKLPEDSFQKTLDRAVLDVLYVYDWLQWVGPYGRLSAETNLIPGDQIVSDNPSLILREGEPSFVDADRVRVTPSFGLTSIQEGAGVNIRFLKTVQVEASARIGIGGRHLIANNLLQQSDDNSRCNTVFSAEEDLARCVVFDRVPSDHSFGIEGALLASARITRWVLINLEVDSLTPFDDFSDVFIGLEGQTTVKLTRYLSLNYQVRFRRQRPVFNDNFEQDLLLRFSVELP